MTMPRVRRLRFVHGMAAVFTVLGAGCTSNRAVSLSPGAESLAAYLQASRPNELQVTDTTGKVMWLHAPGVVRDSLWGLLERGNPSSRHAVSLAAIRTIAEPHFSAGRTLGLAGGVLGSVGIALLIVASTGPEPVY